MRILYFDCPTGISGDMCLASLIDMGIDVKIIKRELKKLPIRGYAIELSKEKRHVIRGTRFRVRVKESRHHRTYKDIKSLIEKSPLKKGVKDLSLAIFKNLALAEGKIHGISPLKVIFHEVGAIDSIVDIVGAAVAINELKADRVYSSPLPLGSGHVDTLHGRLPIPAPATLELTKGIPTVSSSIPMELTTPTGAVILKTICNGFGPMPSMTVENIGYGLGGRDFREAPNAVRAIIGGRALAAGDMPQKGKAERLFVIETNIDDMNPQLAGYLMERLFENGAIEVFFTPVQMKKTRPGILITTIAEEDKKDKLMEIIFTESTSIGVRFYPIERKCLERKSVDVKTAYGKVKVKLSLLGRRVVNIQPEYDDCKKIAEKNNLPVKHIMDIARGACKTLSVID